MIRLATRIIPLLLSLLLSCPWAGGKELKILYWNIQNGMWSDQGNGYDNFVARDSSMRQFCHPSDHYPVLILLKM